MEKNVLPVPKSTLQYRTLACRPKGNGYLMFRVGDQEEGEEEHGEQIGNEEDSEEEKVQVEREDSDIDSEDEKRQSE